MVLVFAFLLDMVAVQISEVETYAFFGQSVVSDGVLLGQTREGAYR